MAAGSRCRGALHMRPCRTAGFTRPSVIAARSWRHGGMPPYGVQRGAAGTARPPLRHAIDLVRRAGCPHPAKPGRLGRKSRARSGGYKIRPYRPAFGFLVGAAGMAARTAPPALAGRRSSQPGHGGLWACRPTDRTERNSAAKRRDRNAEGAPSGAPSRITYSSCPFSPACGRPRRPPGPWRRPCRRCCWWTRPTW